jgi:hypothetical protein
MNYEARDRTSKATVIAVQTETPWYRQRPSTGEHELVPLTRRRARQPSVYIHQRALAALAADGECWFPNETIGLCYGRTWQDGDGKWVVVTDYVAAEAHEAERTLGYCALTPDGNISLQQRAESLYPTAEPVGWGHTHVGEQATFSPLDRMQQEKKDEQCVGLLAYRQRDGFWGFTVYLGPHTDELTGETPLIAAQSGQRADIPPRQSTTPRPTPTLLAEQPSTTLRRHGHSTGDRAGRQRCGDISTGRFTPATLLQCWRMHRPGTRPHDIMVSVVMSTIVAMAILVIVAISLDRRLTTIERRLTVLERVAVTHHTAGGGPTATHRISPRSTARCQAAIRATIDKEEVPGAEEEDV